MPNELLLCGSFNEQEKKHSRPVVRKSSKVRPWKQLNELFPINFVTFNFCFKFYDLAVKKIFVDSYAAEQKNGKSYATSSNCFLFNGETKCNLLSINTKILFGDQTAKKSKAFLWHISRTQLSISRGIQLQTNYITLQKALIYVLNVEGIDHIGYRFSSNNEFRLIFCLLATHRRHWGRGSAKANIDTLGAVAGWCHEQLEG